ncbi:MAG: DUF2167 domain-containing protein [Patescibacteria group bacterium]|jgi:hypothetical protein|nr:DUF2167 domain-containing protein [Patescibacteria group bacterium]
MKKILTVILFCFFLLPTMANAESLDYVSQQYHYSFTIPSGWVEIPKSTIDEVMQQAADMTGGQFIDYAAGFQLENTEAFQYPYILVQQHKVNTPSYSQITQTFESDKFSESVNKKIDEYSELMTNASLQDPFVDKERNIIFMNLEMDVANVGKVKGLLAMFLGKSGITQLNFYSVKSEYSENLSTFNQIIDSFSYEQGYEYNEEEAKKNDSPSIFEGVAEKGIIGAITGGLIALIFGLFSRSKKKEEEK